MAGFNAEAGDPRHPGQARSRLRHLGLLDDLEPDERAFLLDAADPTPAQVADATWRSEALVALRWAINGRDTLPVGGQVSLLQAIPDLGDDDEVRARLAGAGGVDLRPEHELRRELEKWFAVYWRMRLRTIGVERLNLAGWVADNPYLTVLTADDLPLIGGDLSLDAAVMEVARDDPAAEAGMWRLVLPDDADVDGVPEPDWPVEDGRVPIRVGHAGMLRAGENVLRVATERLRALRWLCGVTDQLGQGAVGHYEPGSDAAYDKATLYRDGGYAVRGGLPWCHAAFMGDVARLRSLLHENAPTEKEDIDGDTAVHCAVLGGQREALELLLGHRGQIAHYLHDDRERTVLDLAAARGDLDLIDAIASGPHPSEEWLRHSSALVEAARAGQAAAATRLIELGVALDGALDAAIAGDQPELVRLLVRHGAPTPGEALYRALGTGRLASAAALVEGGADPRYTDDTGTTVLHLAADQGATALCLRLLDAGADLNARVAGVGAVHLAILGGHAATALALMERGADTALSARPLVDLAVQGGSPELVRWCLDRGEVPTPETVEATVLANRPDVLRLLAGAGLPVDVANEHGITPLHLAADRGFPDCVEVLLAAGAPVDALVPQQNVTALDLARMHRHDECVQLLERVSGMSR